MRDKSLVSAIIPTFNRPSYLPEAVESVLDQTHPEIELIVVDDGSEDRGEATKKVLKPYLPYLTYVYQEHQGIGAAVNKGLALAKGEFIQRLDDDDKLEKEKVEKCAEVFKENPNVGLVATGYHIIDEAGTRLRSQMPRSYPKNARLLFMLMACIAAQVAVMVRKSCHDVVGLYRTDTMAEDYEMWLRIAKRYEVATINEPLASYRRHRENITNIENIERFERDTLQFIRRYLEETPLEELIPDIRSKAHGHALKAAVHLLKDGMRVRTIDLAQGELEKALTLAPGDPLIFLWEMALAIHRDDCSCPKEALSNFGEFQEMARTLSELAWELQTLKASSLPPSSPEMTDFRRRFGTLRGELIRETYRKAIA